MSPQDGPSLYELEQALLMLEERVEHDDDEAVELVNNNAVDEVADVVTDSLELDIIDVDEYDNMPTLGSIESDGVHADVVDSYSSSTAEAFELDTHEDSMSGNDNGHLSAMPQGSVVSPIVHAALVAEAVQQYVMDSVITPSSTPWGGPVVLVRKQDEGDD